MRNRKKRGKGIFMDRKRLELSWLKKLSPSLLLSLSFEVERERERERERGEKRERNKEGEKKVLRDKISFLSFSTKCDAFKVRKRGTFFPLFLHSFFLFSLSFSFVCFCKHKKLYSFLEPTFFFPGFSFSFSLLSLFLSFFFPHYLLLLKKFSPSSDPFIERFLHQKKNFFQNSCIIGKSCFLHTRRTFFLLQIFSPSLFFLFLP